MSLMGFVLSMYPGGQKLSVLRLHHGATLQSEATEATVDLHCDMNTFSIVFL
jgi:hypothetical protein